jgi:hypothetical protein
MASLLDKAIRLTAKGFDIERKKLMPPNSWVALLAADRRANSFHQLRYYKKGFITRSNNFRTGFYVEIATADNLQPDVLKCSFFSINGVCYAVGDGDVFPPSGDRFSWMFYGTFVKDVYTPTV